jgi:hypothetical protein
VIPALRIAPDLAPVVLLRTGVLLETFFFAADFLDADFALTTAFFFAGAFFFDAELFVIARFFTGLRAGFFLAMTHQVYQMFLSLRSNPPAARFRLALDAAQLGEGRASRLYLRLSNIVTNLLQSHLARIQQSCWSMDTARNSC